MALSYSLSVVHFPLRMHPFAMQAARASECLQDEHAFEAFIDTVLVQQPQLERKSWNEFAQEVGTTDTSAFVTCLEEGGEFPRIESGLRAAADLGVQATPKVMINGWKYSAPPSAEELLRAAESIRRGRGPYTSVDREK